MVFYYFQVLTVIGTTFVIGHQMPVRGKMSGVGPAPWPVCPSPSSASWGFYPPRAEGRAGLRGTDLITAGSPSWKPRLLGPFLNPLPRLHVILSSSFPGAHPKYLYLLNPSHNGHATLSFWGQTPLTAFLHWLLPVSLYSFFLENIPTRPSF